MKISLRFFPSTIPFLIFIIGGLNGQAAPGDQWTWRNPISPLGTGSAGIAVSIPTASGYVTVGRRGLIVVNGAVRPSGVETALYDVAVNGTVLVAVGDQNTIVTSMDSGVTWSQCTAPGDTSTFFRKVVLHGGKWFALDERMVAVSTDGLTWQTSSTLAAAMGPRYSNILANGAAILVESAANTARSTDGGAVWTVTPTTLNAGPAIWNGSRWITVNGALHQSMDGLAWTAVPSVTGVSRVFNAGGLTVAAGEKLYTSADGTTWTNRGVLDPDSGLTWTALAQAGMTYVLVGNSGIAAVSTDGGISWSRRNTGAEELKTVVHNGTAFIAGGSDGTLATSPDGVTWQDLAPGTRSRLRGVAWHGGLWVAAGRNEASEYGTQARQFSIHTSPDGVTWTDRSFDGDDPGYGTAIYSVARLGTQWAITAQDHFLSSPDGLTWTVRAAGRENRAVAWNGTRLVMAGGTEDKEDGSTGFVHLSDNGGLTWSNQALGDDFLRGIIWSGSRFLAVGDGGSLYQSATGAAGTWNRTQLPTTRDLRGITYDSAAGYIIVGGNTSTGPVLFTSPDGTVWTERLINSTQPLYSATRAGSLWVVTGYDGLVATSPDGVTWTPKPTPTTHELYAGGWNGKEFLAVGEGGTILATSGSPAVESLDWTSFTRQPDGGYRMEWEAVSGVQYQVEGSASLQSPWTGLPGSPVTATAATASLIYTPPAPSPGKMFFRVRTP